MISTNVFRRVVAVATMPLTLLAWQLAAELGGLDARLFPPPLEVLEAFSEMAGNGELTRDIFASLTRALAGLVLGVVTGFACGIATGRFPIFSQSIGQLLSGLRPVPAIAIIPFVIIWLGVDEFAKIVIVSWAVMFPVWISTHIGVGRVDEKHLWAAQSLGASNSQLLWRVVVPSAMPLVTTGIRTGIGLAFISLFASEMAGASDGVGYRIFTSHLVFRVDKMMVGLIVLGLMGAAVDWIFAFGFKRFFPWMQSATRTT